jgi:hypothetical protein
MMHKCLCGSYTNYGSLCVSCAMARMSEDEFDEEIDVEDYLEEIDEDETT